MDDNQHIENPPPPADEYVPPEMPIQTNFRLTGDEGAFFTELAAAQAEFAPIVKNKTVTVEPKSGRPYTFTYADLAEVDTATSPALHKHGFALIEAPFTLNEEWVELRTILGHKVGKLEVSVLFRRPNSPQAYGSALTYLRRYGRSSILGVVSEADDDGNAAEGNAATVASRNPPAAAQRQAARQAPEGAAPNQRNASKAPPMQQQPTREPEQRPKPKPATGPSCNRETMQAIIAETRRLGMTGQQMADSCRNTTGVTPEQLEGEGGQERGEQWLKVLKALPQ